MAEATHRVLVVDDSETILEAVRVTLVGADYEVVTTSSPMLVASELRLRPPDLLLIDVEMPAISGPEVVSALRRNDCLKGTKVVLYSGCTDPGQLDEVARECGAIGAIHKSVVGDELVERVRSHLAMWEQTETSSYLSFEHALVVAPPQMERELLDLLHELKIGADPRGAFGVDQALRQGDYQLLVLAEEPFAGTLEPFLDRLKRRGLLDGVAVLVIGSVAGEHACLQPEELTRGAFRKALKTLFRKQLNGGTD